MHSHAALAQQYDTQLDWAASNPWRSITYELITMETLMKRLERTINYDRSGRRIEYVYDRVNMTAESASQGHSVDESQILPTLHEYSESTNSRPRLTTQYFNAWRQTIEGAGPYGHMFTIAFKQPYTDVEAMNAIRAWCSMMNRSIKGSRWKRKGNGIEGIVAAERHRISLEFTHRLHFHVLIKVDDGLPKTDDLRNSAFKCALRLRDQTNRRMTDLDRVDLREIDDQNWLIGYFIKDIFSPDWQVGDNLAFWSKGSGLGQFRFTPKSPSELRKRH